MMLFIHTFTWKFYETAFKKMWNLGKYVECATECIPFTQKLKVFLIYAKAPFFPGTSIGD